ncbi:MAG: threonine synthase [Eubacteriales bacterium]
MIYVSTRDRTREVPSARAIMDGIAPDGGLYTPAALPTLTHALMEELKPLGYAGRAAKILSLFLTDFTAEELAEYTRAAYNPGKFAHPKGYPASAPDVDGIAVRTLNKVENMLELYWGPTSAFKDMALQLLPYLLTASMKKCGETRTVCILVATSGDTGKAALEGFRDVPGTQIVVFYPREGVSDVQRLQMVTQEGDNVGVCAVEGNFDDAQTGVKKTFGDPEVRAELARHGRLFSSANSINFGRLVPQIVYYISGYLDLVRRGAIHDGERINICVPTGNFGNILAAVFAKHMGLPVGKLICASNANNVLTDFLNTGVYDRNRPFHKTLSPSMDILISSNVERLLYYISGGSTAYVRERMESLKTTGRYEVNPELLREFTGICCDDTVTRATIREVFERDGYLIDPHTAVAVYAAREYRKRTGDDTPQLIASTASAFKFCAGVLEALTGHPADNDFDAIDRLAEYTHEPPPAPLTGLRGKDIRFSGCTTKDGISDAALKLLIK